MTKYDIKFRIIKSGRLLKERISIDMSKEEIQQKYKNNLGVEIIKIKEIKAKKKKSFLRRLWNAFIWFIEDIFTN